MKALRMLHGRPSSPLDAASDQSPFPLELIYIQTVSFLAPS
jgi:hypothetical protein